MIHLLAARGLLCLTLVSALGVSAQMQATAPGSTSAGPAETERTGLAPYRSALEGYQRYSDEPVQPWRESNDNVGKIGGWRVYAREAQGAPAAPAASSKEPAAGSSPPAATTPLTPLTPVNPVAPVAADPHAGHGKR